MKALVINGSPKGEKSNTYRLTSAFLEGIRQESPELELREITVNQVELKPCMGCFTCWGKTPGKCCIRDDMGDVIDGMLWADVIIWSFPLYYFGIPGPLKNLMDRQLPMALPFMARDAESGGHPARYDMSGKRHVVISTCGFYTAKGNYDGVSAIFDHLCGKGNYTSIFCGQGELFRVKELSARTDEYLSHVADAGLEFASGRISEKTRLKLEELLYPREVFEAMADASWGVEPTGERTDGTLTFTRQMAALYRPDAYSGEDIVLEMRYTEPERTYQILLEKTGSRVLTEDFREPTTIIETPYPVWKAIAAGEIRGEEALGQRKYRVKGDFSLMINWDKYFGGRATDISVGKEPGRGKTNMYLLLIPWIVFWIAAPLSGFFGGIFSILSSALMPLIFYRSRKTAYDIWSGFLVTAFSAGLLLGASPRMVIPASYLSFGIMWTVSCFMKIPLTAHYSMNDYNGEAAFQNPLFMKTNRILTLCWGILYLLTSIWTYAIMGTSLDTVVGAINSVQPILMGIFTMWFQKWYPAKMARGE